jgi:hypothetical protein
VIHLATVLGVAPGSPLTWAVPCAYLGLAVLGVAWALTLRRARTAVYEGIGRGAQSGRIFSFSTGTLGADR